MDFVQLYWKRNRGWPWPEESWGLDPMFGEDGWCRSCGTPLREQCGPLTLQRKGLAKPEGAWVPNWRFDTFCLAEPIVGGVRSDFVVDLREVAWTGKGGGTATQIVVPTTEARWFDPNEVRTRTIARHGTDGAQCTECGVWRWMPMTLGSLPPLESDPSWEPRDAIASSEWFGDGKQSFRQVLVRRALADYIASASPRDFKVNDVMFGGERHS
jgi:hypothetical protein